MHAVPPPQIECVLRAPKGLLALEGEHEPGPAHEVLRAGLGHERIDARVRPVEKALPGRGVRLHPLAAGVRGEAQKPGQRAQRMSPADPQRRVRVEQHAGHLPEHAGHRNRRA